MLRAIWRVLPCLFLAVLGLNMLGVSSKAAVSVDGVVWIFASVSLLAMVKVKLSIKHKAYRRLVSVLHFFPQRMECFFLVLDGMDFCCSLAVQNTKFSLDAGDTLFFIEN